MELNERLVARSGLNRLFMPLITSSAYLDHGGGENVMAANLLIAVVFW